MARFGDVIIAPEHEGKEKHVPQIKAPATVAAGQAFDVEIIVGDEVPHPNTIEHHIKWIQLFAKSEGDVVKHVATFDLGPTLADPRVKVSVMLEQSATLYALEYCNIHGVWDNSADVAVE